MFVNCLSFSSAARPGGVYPYNPWLIWQLSARLALFSGFGSVATTCSYPQTPDVLLQMIPKTKYLFVLTAPYFLERARTRVRRSRDAPVNRFSLTVLNLHERLDMSKSRRE